MEGTGIEHQIFRFSGGINIWYSLGPSQTPKVDFFAEILFDCKPLTFFCKRLQLRSLTGSIRRFQKIVFMLC